MRVGSLFSGIGGLDLGLTWAGMGIVWHSEIDPYASAVLRKHWPEVPNVGDIALVDVSKLQEIDLICGGFPCQPFSSAARGRNIADKDRRPDFYRVIFDCKPRYVLAENVSKRAIESFAIRLAQDGGYGTEVFDLSAYDVGADHIRNRWWCLAYPNDQGQFLSAFHAEMAVLSEVRRSFWGWPGYTRAAGVPSRTAHRVDRLRGTGNAVSPVVAHKIGRAIMAAHYEVAS